MTEAAAHSRREVMQTTSDDASSAMAHSSADQEQQPDDDQKQQRPTALLFSLQFFLSNVDLRLPQAVKSREGIGNESRGAGFLIGFQLLQYEIVLFDATAAASDADGGGAGAVAAGAETDSDGGPGRVLLKHQHGKSCLFEADADHLALDLQRECDAPLALLVMQPDHGKARLVAFASVPIELHVGLLNASPDSNRTNGDGVHKASSISQEMRFRVCEWASSSGKWELRDHCNRVVGVATGAVTLSCLGRSLAPHIVNAIGLQVGRAVLPVRDSGDAIKSNRSRVSVRVSSSSLDSNESSGVDMSKPGSRGKSRAVAFDGDKNCDVEAVSADSASKDDEVLLSGLVAAQKADMAIQCDQEWIFGCEEADAAERSCLSLKTASRGNCQVYPAIRIESMEKHPHTYSSEQQLRPSPAKTRAPHLYRPDHHSSPHSEQRKKNSSHRQHDELDCSLFARDLPPPLFFHKPKQQQRTKKR